MDTKAELQSVMDDVREASRRLYGDKLSRIILYGSYARGDYTKDSDVDIMILLDCDKDEVKQLRSRTCEMASDISVERGVFLSVLLRDRKQFEDQIDFLPFYQNVVREGVVVYG